MVVRELELGEIVESLPGNREIVVLCLLLAAYVPGESGERGEKLLAVVLEKKPVDVSGVVFLGFLRTH